MIPDFIPVIGYLDDLIIVPLGIALALKLIHRQIMLDCRERARGRRTCPHQARVGAAIMIAAWLAAAIWGFFSCAACSPEDFGPDAAAPFSSRMEKKDLGSAQRWRSPSLSPDRPSGAMRVGAGSQHSV